jgi:hypothetical protein
MMRMNMHEPGQGKGLVDAHVHCRNTAAFEVIRAAGIAAVRDAGMRQNVEQGFPLQPAPGKGPLVVSSGWALYRKGGYGSQFGLPIEGREDILREILRLKAAGAGIIKVMASGMVSLENKGTVTDGGFDQDELTALVHEAQHEGLAVMAHANGEQAIIACASAGVRSIEHGFFMTGRALEKLAKKGIFWIPTVGALARAAASHDLSQEMKASIDELIRSHLTMINRANALGVPLAIGTDYVLPGPGYRDAFDAEMAYFEQAGLSGDIVSTIACEGGARLLGI